MFALQRHPVCHQDGRALRSRNAVFDQGYPQAKVSEGEPKDDLWLV